MATNQQPVFEGVAVNAAVHFVRGSSETTITDLVTGATEGTRIDSIVCTTNDTAAVTLDFYLSISGTDYFIGQVYLPTLTGYSSSAPRVEAMRTLADYLIGAKILASGNKLRVKCDAAMAAAAKVCDIVATGGNFTAPA